MYLYKRGKGAGRRVMHLPEYNRHGQVIGTLCRQKAIRLDTSCNLPLDRLVCKKCRATL